MTAPAMTKTEREDLQRLNASTAQAGNKFTHANCAICGKHDYVAPLYGERGGPLTCLLCVGQWNAEHGRRRRAERVVIKALKAYEAAGGNIFGVDFNRLMCAAGGSDLFHEADGFVDFNDLTSELLDATVALTHPDKHPPERKAEATRVTQELLALKPFVFPAAVPEPPPSTEPRDESALTDLSTELTDLSTELSRYPCLDCRDLSPRQIPHYYCAACKAEWEKRREDEYQREAAKQRAWYAQRKERRLRATPPTTCPICGAQFKGRRKDARFCSDGCRQRAHRQSVTDKFNLRRKLDSSRDSRGRRKRADRDVVRQ